MAERKEEDRREDGTEGEEGIRSLRSAEVEEEDRCSCSTGSLTEILDERSFDPLGDGDDRS